MHFETGDDADGAEPGDTVGHTEQVLAGATVGGEEVGDTAHILTCRVGADADKTQQTDDDEPVDPVQIHENPEIRGKPQGLPPNLRA